VRVVVDPGVLVSALLSQQGPPDTLVRLWGRGAFELVVSPLLLAELEEVLRRPRIARRTPVARVRAFLRALQAGGVQVEDPADIPAVTRDPKDDYLLALGRAAGADLIVSGDRDLLEADVSPPVLTPRELLDLLERAQPT
jgi:putative PIN family toxin of toxin-antitoxin system